jgi:hypothetical protein
MAGAKLGNDVGALSELGCAKAAPVLQKSTENDL